MYESIEALEIRTSIVFTLSFPNNTILSYFLFFFCIIDLYFLIPAVIATGTQTNEADAAIVTQPVNFDAKKTSVQHNLNTYMPFYTFYSLNH